MRTPLSEMLGGVLLYRKNFLQIVDYYFIDCYNFITRRKQMGKAKIYKRYNVNNRITLYNGDCYKLLKRIPDNSIDLIVTSPPYCIGKAY